MSEAKLTPHQIELEKKEFDYLTRPIAHKKHRVKSLCFWFAIAGLIFEVFGLIIYILKVTLPECSHLLLYKAAWAKVWFGYLHYFTTQSNLIVLLYFIFFLCLFKTKIFNNRNFATAVACYINLTMITYWVCMGWMWFNGDMFKEIWFTWVASFTYHLICPVLFDFHYFYGVNYPYRTKDLKNPLNRIYLKNFWAYLLIYLVIYGAYAFIINFIQLPTDIYRDDIISTMGSQLDGHQYATVYGFITNFNKNCYNTLDNENGWLMFDTTSTGNIFYVMVIFPLAALFAGIYLAVVELNNQAATPEKLADAIDDNKKQYKSKEKELRHEYAKIFHQEWLEYERNKDQSKNKVKTKKSDDKK